MIISHKLKCIFIRIPKTASTSIETFIKKYDPDCISSIDTPPYGHFTADDIKNNINLKIWNEYFKFCFIRNPYDWIVSNYCDNLKFSHLENKELDILLDNHYLPTPDKYISADNIIVFYILLKKWFNNENQSRFINDDIDFIGLYENIDKDFDYIKNKLNIEDEYQLDKMNITKKKYELSEDSYKIVDILYKTDLELYNNITN